MGQPTEDEVQAQWRAAVDIIDQTRVYGDGLAAATTGEFDVLVAALEGDYTPDGLANWMANFRAGLSSLVGSNVVYEALAPCILEYGQVLKSAGSIGSGLEQVEDLIQAIYEHFINTPEYVESREITFDLNQTVTGTGDGQLSRLVVDENAFDIEACHAETKIFRCMRDQTSGALKSAEQFQMFGVTRGRDNFLQGSFGSGDLQRRLIYNRNGGTGQHGSLVKNSSFQSYDATQDNDFTFWELVSGTVPTQSTADAYQSFPGNTDTHSLSASAAFRLKQSRKDLRRTSLNPNRPYFLRVMLKTASGTPDGNCILHLGSRSVTVASTTVTAAAGWYELHLPLDENSWFKNFNQDDFNIEIESTMTTGTILWDDLIFCEMTQIDGTWWVMRANDPTPTPWKKDDEIQFVDTQVDATKGKINYYLWRAGLGYLPSSTGTPTITFTDP